MVDDSKACFCRTLTPEMLQSYFEYLSNSARKSTLEIAENMHKSLVLDLIS